MSDVREKFAEYKRPGFFSRVDNHHILELYLGLDTDNKKSIELRYPFNPRRVRGTSSIDVNQYHKAEYNTIRFSLLDEEISGLFYKFCEDLIDQTRDLKDEAEGYQTIINRFFQWKKLFVASKNNFLTEPEIMGLIGEIIFLRGNLAERIGLSDALRSWSGQELTHKDFSHENMWFEVKTIHRSAQTVRISSLEQLDSESSGELVVISLEKMSAAYNGITLNKLILETRNMFDISEDKDAFMSKVALQGYKYNDYYDDFVYEINKVMHYIVNDIFPRLTPGSVPDAIIKVSYDISLKDISAFEKKE